MAELLEYVGCIHIYLGPYRGNPVALYMKRMDNRCEIGPRAYPWNDVVGAGETPNKAAADFEEKWKTKGLAPEMFSGPAWEGGIKPERPAPPKPAAPPAAAILPTLAGPRNDLAAGERLTVRPERLASIAICVIPSVTFTLSTFGILERTSISD